MKNKDKTISLRLTNEEYSILESKVGNGCNTVSLVRTETLSISHSGSVQWRYCVLHNFRQSQSGDGNIYAGTGIS